MQRVLFHPLPGKYVSDIVLGSVSFSWKGKENAFRLLDDFVASGGTAVDTARGYGESEQVIGAWLEARGTRNEVFLITKGGLSSTDACSLAADGLDEKLESDLTASIENLRTDTIDLYFLHRDAPAHPVGPIMEALARQRDKGRIRALGASNWAPCRVDQANEYADQHGLAPFSAVSNNLSLAVPTAPFYPGLVFVDDVARRWFLERGIPLFSWSSQARGFFTGQFRPSCVGAASPGAPPLSAFARRMLEVYGTPENDERLRRAERLGLQKGGYSAIQIAVAWLLHQSFEVFPLVGPRTPEELDSCCRALEIQLTPREVRWLNLETEEENP